MNPPTTPPISTAIANVTPNSQDAWRTQRIGKMDYAEDCDQKEQNSKNDAIHEPPPRSRNDHSCDSSKGQHADGDRNNPIRANADGTQLGHEEGQQEERPQAELIPGMLGRGHVVNIAQASDWENGGANCDLCRAISHTR